MKTGNCWNGRHHTCKGYGKYVVVSESGKRGKPAEYTCDCQCHSKRKNSVERIHHGNIDDLLKDLHEDEGK